MSREELEKWLNIYGKDIYSFCRKLTKDKAEADDLYQDTFLKMVELYDRLDIRQNPKSYLLSVAVNLWRNRKRKFSWRQRITGPCISLEELVMDVPSGKKSVEEQMISKEERKLVRAAVDALPEKYKLPVLLFYMEELKLSEISQILNIPEGTVKSRLYKAKQVLKRELEVVLNGKRT